VEKYSRGRQATDDNIIRRMRIACCITKATDRRSEYEIRIAFPRQQLLTRTPLRVRFIRTLPLLLIFTVVRAPNLILSLRDVPHYPHTSSSVTTCMHEASGWICSVELIVTSVSSGVGNPDDDTRQVSILHGKQSAAPAQRQRLLFRIPQRAPSSAVTREAVELVPIQKINSQETNHLCIHYRTCMFQHHTCNRTSRRVLGRSRVLILVYR
jgi:hypothetical protein